MEIILNDTNFEKEIKEAKLPILVDFFATWCEPCSMLAPILEKTAKEMDGKIILAKANVDESPVASQKYGVEKIPTVVLFANGNPISGFVGMSNAESIKKWIEDALQKKENPSVDSSENKDEQEEINKLKKEYAEYAKANGFNLNPDEKTVDRIVKGLLANEKKYGKKYCPCRRVSGDAKEDEKKICPCVWHKDEIEKDGKCFCGLYVK
jgi:thioredoxin 1